MKFILLLIAVLSLLLSCTGTQSNAKQSLSNSKVLDRKPEYVIKGSQVHTITSTITEKEYELMISVPEGYNDSGNTQTYPVVYVLDGQWLYTLFLSAIGSVEYDGDMPKPIQVAITWGGENPDYLQLRGEDFTPTNADMHKNSGMAPKFLQFIKQELIPYVHKEFRANDFRVLAGASYSGLFSWYALFKEPSLFDGHIALTPSLWWDNQVMMNYQKDFLDTKLTKPIKVFTARGEYETQKLFNEFTEVFEKNPIDNFSMKAITIAKAGHSTVSPLGFTRGLQYIFEKNYLDLDSTALSSYAGSYLDTLKNDTINVWVKENKITLPNWDGTDLSLEALTDSTFTQRGLDATFSFVKGKNEEITELHTKSRWGFQSFLRLK